MSKPARPRLVRTAPDPAADAARVMADPRFQALVRQRTAFAWTLTAITVVIYVGFVLLAAFDKPLMATTPFGGVTSLGIVLGLLVIVAAFVLTGVYVVRANSTFDRLAAEIREGRR